MELERKISESGRDPRKNNIIVLSPLIIVRVKKYAVKYLEQYGGYKVKIPRKLGIKRKNFGLKYYELIVEYLQQSINGLPCYHCRTPITIGEKCLSKHKGYNSRSYFHVACAEKINLI
jgi:hypothetical protein